MVSDNLKSIKPVTNFSQRACRERFDALATNTAKPPPELIPHKTEEILKRIQSRKEKEMKILIDGGFNMIGYNGPHTHDKNTPLLPATPLKKRARNQTSAASSSRRPKRTSKTPATGFTAVAPLATTDVAGNDDAAAKALANGAEHYDSEAFANAVESDASSDQSLFDPRKA
jgi:hypothetical protein